MKDKGSRGNYYFLIVSITILLGVFIILRCGNEGDVVDDGGSGAVLIDEVEVIQEGGVLRIGSLGSIQRENNGGASRGAPLLPKATEVTSGITYTIVGIPGGNPCTAVQVDGLWRTCCDLRITNNTGADIRGAVLIGWQAGDGNPSVGRTGGNNSGYDGSGTGWRTTDGVTLNPSANGGWALWLKGATGSEVIVNGATSANRRICLQSPTGYSVSYWRLYKDCPTGRIREDGNMRAISGEARLGDTTPDSSYPDLGSGNYVTTDPDGYYAFPEITATSFIHNAYAYCHQSVRTETGNIYLESYLVPGGSDCWLPTYDVPLHPQSGHTAVWTGSEMIVWGGGDYGWSNSSDQGMRYNPVTNIWSPISRYGIPDYEEGFETGDFSAFPWVTGGNANWYVESIFKYSGTYAAASGSIGNNQTTYLEVTLTFSRPGAIYFYRRVSTAFYHYLTFKIDGVERGKWSHEVPWGEVNYYFPAGTHTFRWEYTKDSRTLGGYDKVWIDNIRWTTSGSPSPREGHTAVWTGSEMIVWGGYDGATRLNTGGRYNPVTDSWVATTTTNAPSGRDEHTAVWTGSEMIVWGGSGGATRLNTGGRYNPVTDSWVPTSITNAPSPRWEHTAVWTGSEMIVWGGGDVFSVLDTGGRYNPVTDSWVPTSTTGAPSPRWEHTAVWTGSEMIVWGGWDLNDALNTGGRYNPLTDEWVKILGGPPVERYRHSALWTGSHMLISGGEGVYYSVPIGAKYDPVNDGWESIASVGAPGASSTSAHTAVWTGSEMIVCSCFGYSYCCRYDPNLNSWFDIVSVPPLSCSGHTAVWTGSEMIIYGGEYPQNGGRYNPVTDSWIPTSIPEIPSARSHHTAVWTGSEMIVWGGLDSGNNLLNSGGIYDPIVGSWFSTSTTNAPSPRWRHTAVWTGNEMIVWGGIDGIELDTGGRYNPSTDTWVATSTTNAPLPRWGHTAVWTGNEMIVWGGVGGGDTGGRYNPVTDSWTATSTTNAPSPGERHTAVWTGSEMIVWGGWSDTGGRYNPVTDSWTATSTTNAPSPRWEHTAVWTGSEMIVWGGQDDWYKLNTGGRYNPATDTWSPTHSTAPMKYGHAAIWTGNEMIVWGGRDDLGGSKYNPLTDTWLPISLPQDDRLYSIECEKPVVVWTGVEMIVWGCESIDPSNYNGRYNPITDTWLPISLLNAPLYLHSTAVWTGTEMIVWGGTDGSSCRVNSGGKYNPVTDSWRSISTTNAPEGRCFHTAVWTGSEMIVWGGIKEGEINFPIIPLNTGGRYWP